MFSPKFLSVIFILKVITSQANIQNDQNNTPGINNNYVVDRMVNFYNQNSQGIYASVVYQGTDEFYQKETSPNIQNLNVTVTYDTDNELTIVIDDATQPRFRLPYESPYPYTKPSPLIEPFYNVEVQKNPFSFAIYRTKTGEKIFDTSSFDFVYSDYFMTFGTTLPSQYLYGLGERRRDFLYDSGIYTIWNKDQFAQIDEGQGNQQTYGCHPMYLMRENSGFWNIVYLRNSNGMDFKYDAGAQTLQYFLTGSVIELKVFLSYEMPDQVINLYHNYINGWSLMPFWSHGYHQSKFGILYFQDLLDVVGNFSAYKIPIDTIWSDIDYMYSFTDFTIDQERYDVQQLKNLAEKLHWVPIVDAGVSLNSTADSYNLGQAYNVWIKSANNNTNPLVGVVWPGVVHWPDWLNPNASSYWNQLLKELHSSAPFSGIWLDMNENSNFCSGEYNNSCYFLQDYLPDGVYPDGNTNIPAGDQNSSLPPSPWAWFNSSALPYIPGGVPLEDKSLSINALHYGNVLEFNLHNVNGFLETSATYKALQSLTGERPFILSRSTHVGSGQFAAHWSGDNYASWDFLRLSISCIFNFQLFGIPMSGDDICGFAGNTTVELCARWMQLGAFYPFMRNHMAIGEVEHYPYSLGDTVLQASLASLKLRYSILKYYYSLFIMNQGQGTIFRPIFFDFYNDMSLLSLDTQFLIGSYLMVAAVTEEGQEEVSVYFPSGAPWYDFFTGRLVHGVNDSAQNLTFPAPLNGTLPVFVKGGALIPVQEVDNVTSTSDLNNVFNLVIALLPISDLYMYAQGTILSISNYSDDASVDKCIQGQNCQVSLSVSTSKQSNGTIFLSILYQGLVIDDIYINNITVYGVPIQSCPSNQPDCVEDNSGVVVCNVDDIFKIFTPAISEFYIDGTNCIS